MAEQRHNAAFVMGALFGGFAAAGLALWKTPKAGAQLRAELAANAEDAIFKLTEIGGHAPPSAETWTDPLLQMAPLPVEEPAAVETPPRPSVPVVDLVPPGV